MYHYLEQTKCMIRTDSAYFLRVTMLSSQYSQETILNNVGLRFVTEKKAFLCEIMQLSRINSVFIRSARLLADHRKVCPSIFPGILNQ